MALQGGTKAVTAAGTAERLVASSTIASSVVIRAKAANTNPIFIGDSTVSSSTNAGLEAEAAISWSSDGTIGTLDLTNIWVDATTNGEGVDYWYVEANERE